VQVSESGGWFVIAGDVYSVVEVLTQLNQVQRPRSHHRPSSLQLLGITSKSSAKPPLHHASAASSKSESLKSLVTD